MDLRSYVGGMFSAMLTDAADHAKAVLEDHPKLTEVLTHIVSAEEAFLNALDTTPAAVVAPTPTEAPTDAQAPVQAAADPIPAEAVGDSGGAGAGHAATEDQAAPDELDDSADPGPAAAAPMPGADHPVTGPVETAPMPGADHPVTGPVE